MKLSNLIATVASFGTLFQGLAQGMNIVQETFIDTQLTTFGKHIHLDHVFRHKNGVYCGDYFNNHRLNGDTLKEEKRTIWTDSFFTFMWIPHEAAVVQDHYVVYASHQRNGSPPPYCAVLKYDLDSMYPDVGRSDTIKPSPTDSSTVGFYSLPVDHQRGLVHLLNGGDFITISVNGTFSDFRKTKETTFSTSSTGHYAALSQDGLYLYFTDGTELKKMDVESRKVVDSIKAPGRLGEKGSLSQIVMDPNGRYGYSISVRTFIREFPNITTECYLIKFDIQNFDIADYVDYTEYCDGADFSNNFGFIEPTNKFVYFGSASPTRIKFIDTVVKIETSTLKVVETLKTNYQLAKVVYDRNNQALAVGTLKDAPIEDQYAMIIKL
jgi:hypothetical protein